MEFLAESIGLLDLDSDARAYVAPAPEASEARAREGTNSLSLFRWWGGDASSSGAGNVAKSAEGESGPSLDREAEADGRQRDRDNHDYNEKPSPKQLHRFASVAEDDDLEQFLFGRSDTNDAVKGSDCRTPVRDGESNNTSYTSIQTISSLSPNSPLTLSASTSNCSRCSSDTPKKKLSLCEEEDEAPPDRGNSAGISPGIANDASRAPPQATHENIITKHVTHRLHRDSCFTGNVDALTGHRVHGTLISKDGSVYEGPFARRGGESVRHGNGECSFANGMKFVGRYGWGAPREGVWFGDGWVYEGELTSGEDVRQSGVHGNSQRIIGIADPLPGSVLFHGTGRFMRPNGHVYQGEFMWGVAQGVGKEVLPDGRGVYYGEFCDGVRHGVGTLVEYYWEDESENDDDCCDEMGGQEGGEQWEQSCSSPRERPMSKQAESELADDISFATVDLGDQSTCLSDNGPDFAAGGSTSSAITEDHSPTTAQHDTTASSITMSLDANAFSPTEKTTSPSRTEKQSHRPKNCPKSQNDKHKCHASRKMKQRFSSGVWIAGQYEIEDSRGILHPGSNQVVEEEVVDSKDKSEDDDHLDRSVTSSSLNRTTWDLLPEKWLGLG